MVHLQETLACRIGIELLTDRILLAAFAVERLTRSRSIRRCEFSGCERLFLPGKSEKRYCEDKCRYADAKRKARATQKS